MILPKTETVTTIKPLPSQTNTVHRSQQQLLLADLWSGWSAVSRLSDDLIRPLAAAEL